MRRILCLMLVALMLLALPTSVSAAELDGQAAAEKLHALGLLAGVGTNADGSVNFDTAGNLNRAQAITQIVRFLGAEKTALSESNAHPFSDVPAWAVPYVSYAYANKITNGVSAKQFGSDALMSDAAFLTLVLRVLGYDDVAGDFAWDNPYALAKKAGLVYSDVADRDFTRGEAFLVCYRALTAPVKSGDSLKDQLIAKGVFTADAFAAVTKDVPESRLYTIDELNVDTTAGSHAEEDIFATSLEINYRDTVQLSNNLVGTTLYTDVFYPRIQKVRDDLYLLTYMTGQFGGSVLYYATSADGVNWNYPEELWVRTEREGGERFTYEEGPLAGKTSSLTAVNPDFCVLQNGDILAVYYVRPTTSQDKYEPYFQYCGVFLKRGTVNADNTITWGKQQQLTRGRGWEPAIHQRPDGRIEVYWTNASTGIQTYGDADWSCTCMVYSDDNGFTWTPDIEAWKDTNYLYIDIFQQHAGMYQPPITDAEGKLVYPEPVPFFKGQMPVVTTLYNGKSLLAVEVRANEGNTTFFITLATSGENGEWTPLAYGEDATEITDAISIENRTEGAGPYVSTFPSGEVFLVYSRSSRTLGRLVSPDGKTEGTEFLPIPQMTNGIWPCCAVVDSHKAMSAVRSDGGDDGVSLFINTLYLNHRISAKKAAIEVDGYTNDWMANKDALFVGSESQAQTTVRVAHDETNVYFLFSLLDYYLTGEDAVTVCVADTAVSDRRITVFTDGRATLETYQAGQKLKSAALYGAKTVIKGTVNDNSDKDEGVVIEIAVPKATLGLENASDMQVRLMLTNNDGGESVTDTLTDVSEVYTENWPTVTLD